MTETSQLTYRESSGDRADRNAYRESTWKTPDDVFPDASRKTSSDAIHRTTAKGTFSDMSQTAYREASGQTQSASSERTRGTSGERMRVPKSGESARGIPLNIHGETSGRNPRGTIRTGRETHRDSGQYTVRNVMQGDAYHGPNLDVTLPSWTVVSPLGPTLSHHVGAVIRNRFYVHGGINKKASTKPLDKLFVMDMRSGLWSEVRAARCPALSHHAGLAIEDRYLVLVGGWNGHKRCTDIFVYDAQEDQWLVMDTSGFPVTGGLSSHAIIQIDSGDLLVVGREGGARTQRRMCNVYLLRGSVLRNRFVYEEQSLEPASRSGHTMHFVPGNLLCIIGGRANDPIEGHRGFHPRGMTRTPGVLGRLRELCQDKLRPATGVRIPGGRKNHVSIAGAGAIFIHGGETFDGRKREPVGEMILVVTRPELHWYTLGATSEGRAGHVCVQHEDDVYIHGGEGAKGVVYGTTYKLCV